MPPHAPDVAKIRQLIGYEQYDDTPLVDTLLVGPEDKLRLQELVGTLLY